MSKFIRWSRFNLVGRFPCWEINSINAVILSGRTLSVAKWQGVEGPAFPMLARNFKLKNYVTNSSDDHELET